MAEKTKVRVRDGSIVFGERGFWLLLVLIIFSVYFSHYSLGILSTTLALVWLSSRLWAKNALRNVIVKESVSNTEVFPGEMISIELAMTNNKWLPVPWLELSRSADKKVTGLDSLYHNVDGARELCRLGWLQGKHKRIIDYTVQPSRRGYYAVGAEQISSGDPFVFFHQDQNVKEPLNIIVYPHFLDSEWLGFNRKDPLGSKPHLNFIFTDPLFASGVREYQPSDTLRQINWVASARFQSLKSNIWEGKADAKCMIFLETKSILQNCSWPEKKKELAWEVLISSVATQAMILTNRRQKWSFFSDSPIEQQDNKPFILHHRSNQFEQMRELLFFLAQLEREQVSSDYNFSLSEIPIPLGVTLTVFSAQISSTMSDILGRYSATRNIAWMLLESTQSDLSEAKSSFNMIELIPDWEENRVLADLLLGS